MCDEVWWRDGSWGWGRLFDGVGWNEYLGLGRRLVLVLAPIEHMEIIYNVVYIGYYSVLLFFVSGSPREILWLFCEIVLV